MTWEIVALIITWCAVIPYLVLFPPKLEWIRTRWLNRTIRKQINALKMDPKWQSSDGTITIPKHRRSIVVLVNRRSGGQVGSALLIHFRSLLHPMQVIDLADESPESVLRRIRGNYRILACGGDGTIGWIISATRALVNPIPIGIVPLGTGNDLSRSLGSGSGFAINEVSRENLTQILWRTVCAKTVLLDRWNVTITEAGSSTPVVKPLNNYFSFGIDAEINMKFHKERENFPERFTSQAKNVAKYAWYGFEGAFDGVPLEDKVQVFSGDREIHINPHWKGVVVSNLPCYQGGKNFWGDADGDNYLPSSMSDSLLEVMGLSGTFHIGLIHVAIDSALRLDQTSSIRMVVRSPIAMQIDGEPWIQNPGTLTITLSGHYPMLHFGSDLAN